MTIGRICRRGVASVGATATLRQAAWLMGSHRVSELVVTVGTELGEQPVGLLSNRDLAIEALMGGFDAPDNHVMQLANPRFTSVPEDTRIADAAVVMRTAGVQRLLVTGDGGRPVGIVFADDLARRSGSSPGAGRRT